MKCKDINYVIELEHDEVVSIIDAIEYYVDNGCPELYKEDYKKMKKELFNMIG